MSLVASFAVFESAVSIFLSAGLSVGFLPALNPSRFISTNREAFHTLLAKLRYPRMRFSSKARDVPGVFPTINPMRNASVQYFVVRSNGLMTFPLDLDIFFPLASNTKPWRYTVLNG